MRYTAKRKYPITEMKKKNPQDSGERIIDISVGTAAGLLAVVFFKGLFWGYIIRKCID
ncbi:MAG: hypothetical protein GX940_01030 [Clostridiaceae bacterium]|jgi:hypothetical protein|nr:hypothetical protein [Clostridiaceae bacterium]